MLSASISIRDRMRSLENLEVELLPQAQTKSMKISGIVIFLPGKLVQPVPGMPQTFWAPILDDILSNLLVKSSSFNLCIFQAHVSSAMLFSERHFCTDFCNVEEFVYN